MDAVVRMRGITKSFGSVAANDGVDLELRRGEILALLGENGAGKSTLMAVLFGSIAPDSGTVEVGGRVLPPGDTRAAIRAGVGMVHQHFTLGENLSVLDNIVLGSEPLHAWRRRRGEAAARIGDIAARCGFRVDLDSRVQSLSVGEKQRVEILKALYRDTRVLVMDEPTAVLAPRETDNLFRMLRKLAADGLAVIFISHKMREIFAVSDRIAVLRRGVVTHEVATGDADPERVTKAMFGSEVRAGTKRPAEPGEDVLKLEDVSVPGGPGQVALRNATLTVRSGEIVGVAGISGNGQAVLADLACGLVSASSGSITWPGPGGDGSSPPDTPGAMGKIPEDRLHVGVVGQMSVAENIVLTRYPEFSRRGFLSEARIRGHAKRLCEEFDVRCASVGMGAGLLSGGNMQKLILARELSGEPRLIVANQPTRGLDIGAVSAVHSRLLEAAARGAGILLITEDLDELHALSDRVAVMFRGALSPACPAGSVTLDQVGRLMSGQAEDEAA